MGGRTVETAKLGRYREIDAGLVLFKALELTPAQQAVYPEIADELAANGFELEPFGSRTVAVKIAPAGVDAAQVEHMLHELLDQFAARRLPPGPILLVSTRPGSGRASWADRLHRPVAPVEMTAATEVDFYERPTAHAS